MEQSQLLTLLEGKRDAFVSGEEISRLLGVSRTAVWKQIRKLEAEGFAIEAVPRKGYRLTGRPSRLNAAELQSKLGTTAFGRHLHIREVVTSTQDVLRELAEEGAPEGTLVIAERQDNGRGRMGRSWVSPPGRGVSMSLLLRPDVPLQLAPQLTLLAAVALCRSLGRETGLPIGIKWPNDLLVDGRKISGILLESATEDERLRYVAVGLGIAVNLDADDYPEELLARAVSLKMAAGRAFDRTALIAAVLLEFEQLYAVYKERGFEPIRILWETYSVTLNRTVSLNAGHGFFEGVPRGLDESGGLRVELPDGGVRTIYSAEIGDAAPLPDAKG
ncbi:BirA family transcriptional regulator, biotin operon repressor / biotin-[acetyl-CoA-carboxylase] ligase [Cohnella sp. OV330]|uniref:biotin--[acetyl-CoA-carboxylase] ligase n=1 Tax=Cohnella sp. OV330 TaxID=1855288 RepID=UPI0008E9AF50|nr:biotin--[acetyl-CoA-carboxylase] ligase [Cohnella sp. OV330]SFB17689.1 BirA family transcriptional regulator, biotin operon repressor / biotin-[acetyl-CoA-carboxylase] ligase [Cohnella sp. OV330]